MTHGTVEWPVRCGDTRVLPALLAALTKSQRSHFLGPWHAGGRPRAMVFYSVGMILPNSPRRQASRSCR